MANHRSVSQFTTYAACGERYRLEKIMKAPSRPAAWLVQGTAFHHAIEMWERCERDAPVEQAQLWFKEYWDSEFAQMVEKWPNPMDWITGGRKKAENDWRDRFNLGIQQVADYIAYARATSDEWRILEVAPDIPALELSFELQFGSAVVKGYIDQVLELRNGAIRVRDLKTGTKLPSSPFQLAVYSLALDEQWGFDAPTGDFYMSKNVAATDPYDLTQFTRPIVSEWFSSMDEAVKHGFFLPNPGDGCRICSVSKFCSIMGTDKTYQITPKEVAHNGSSD